jgi:predicted DNA-binding transcriptional regulator YafY
VASSEKLIRLLKIISIIEHRQGAELQCLAGECDVSERTIYRDIEALSMGGMPIYFDNTTHRYRFTDKVF